jgi:tetratricopeptide (TPR) repeat protein
MRAAPTAAAALLLVTGCVAAWRTSPPWPAGVAPYVELGHVPFHAQRRYQCGPAALASMLAAAGVAVDPERLVGEVYLPARRGSLQTELVAAVRRRDLLAYELEPTLEALVREVDAGRPALVLQNLGAETWPRWHYAVVIGYDVERDLILLHSGTRARRALTRARFEATWRRGGRWAIVVTRPDDVPGTARPLRFVRVAADLEQVGRARAARAAYRAAVERWPREPLPRVALAGSLLAGGDSGAAEQVLREAIAAGAADAIVFNNLADLLGRRGCRTAALRLLERAEGSAPSGQIAAAVAVTRRELELQPEVREPADCATP